MINWLWRCTCKFEMMPTMWTSGQFGEEFHSITCQLIEQGDRPFPVRALATTSK